MCSAVKETQPTPHTLLARGKGGHGRCPDKGTDRPGGLPSFRYKTTTAVEKVNSF